MEVLLRDFTGAARNSAAVSPDRDRVRGGQHESPSPSDELLHAGVRHFEVGWRGFALPRLQARHSALVASLLLTVGWAVWHAPLFLYRPEYMAMGLSGVAGWLLSLMTGSILLTWLYNESHGSLLVVAIFHATVDVAFTSEISSSLVVNAAGALITIGGILVIVLAGPRYLSRRGKVVRMLEGSSITGFVPRDGNAATRTA